MLGSEISLEWVLDRTESIAFHPAKDMYDVIYSTDVAGFLEHIISITPLEIASCTVLRVSDGLYTGFCGASD